MRILDIILSLPKTLWFNFSSMPFKEAIRLPIIVNWRTKFVSLKGKVSFTEPVHFGMLKIGFNGSMTARYQPCVVENNGTIFSGDHSYFGGGCQICTVGKESVLKIGNNCKFMAECHIVSSESIFFGNDCIVSWNTQIMDSDMHAIFGEQGQLKNPDNPVLVGDHVWICSGVSILKGTSVGSGTILSAGSVIVGQLDSNSVYTGMPLKKISSKTRWDSSDFLKP